MASIGPQLAAAREAKHLTVSDVATRLHMRSMFVDALERERWDLVGERVYVRGFLKNYARFVGLDPAPLLEELRNEYDNYEVASPAREIENGVAEEPYSYSRHVRTERQSSFYTWLLGALTTVAALLVFLVVRVYFFAPNDTSAQSMQSADQSRSQTAQTAGGSEPVAASPAPNALIASEQTDGAQPGVDLRLQLTQNCWLSVTVDGKRVLYETLPAGSVKEFRGAKTITLRAGNAGGVIATVDGRPLGALGSTGQVQDRVFAAKTVQPPVTGPRE